MPLQVASLVIYKAFLDDNLNREFSLFCAEKIKLVTVTVIFILSSRKYLNEIQNYLDFISRSLRYRQLHYFLTKSWQVSCVWRKQ